jgi:hypothetical protein
MRQLRCAFRRRRLQGRLTSARVSDPGFRILPVKRYASGFPASSRSLIVVVMVMMVVVMT